MKLLLTSAGVKNQSIAGSLIKLVGKPVEDIKIGFIPTAANVELGNKDWFIGQFILLQQYGFAWIDIVDISAPNVDWRQRLSEVDVVLVCGGNTFHLLDQLRKTGFDAWLLEHIEDIVYVGISAGSIITTPTIAIAGIDDGDKNIVNVGDTTGLSLVNFIVSPHTPENVSHEANKNYANSSKYAVYGIDNQTAVQVIGKDITLISEGEWILY